MGSMTKDIEVIKTMTSKGEEIVTRVDNRVVKLHKELSRRRPKGG